MPEAGRSRAVTSIIIALIGLFGSLGGAWIAAGAKFDRALEKKDSELRDLSAKVEKLQKTLDSIPHAENILDQITALSNARAQDVRSLKELDRKVNGLSGIVNGLTESVDSEGRSGFGGAASQGTKACMITVRNRWIDVITLPRHATALQCEVLRDFEASGSGTGYYKLGCFTQREGFRWADGGAVPSPNCGW
jgi:hypothetical protein